MTNTLQRLTKYHHVTDENTLKNLAFKDHGKLHDQNWIYFEDVQYGTPFKTKNKQKKCGTAIKRVDKKIIRTTSFCILN
jgi:hypothetical protein